VINSSNRYSKAEMKLSKYPIMSIRRYFYFKRAVKEAILTEQPDIVHLHWLFDLPQLAAARNANVPIIATPYGSDLLLYSRPTLKNFFKSIINRQLTSSVVRKAKYFCCDAVHLRTRLIQLGASPQDVEIIYFGTDTEEFSPSLKSTSFREHLGISENDIIILSNRGLSPIYDVKTFVLAAKHVLKVNEKVRFLIAGGGPLLHELQQLTQQLDISHRVMFLGRLSDKDFGLTTGNADIYVSTSTSDGGLAASVAEAMSCGIPVVITEFGDNSKWLEDSTAGFSFDIGDDQKLASILLDLASNPELRTRLGNQGRKIISSRNNSKIEITKVIGLYEKALERP
jgi:glycosyltransferase involved in cell wall biosynthesis